MHFKRLAALAAAGCIAFSMTGCGSKDGAVFVQSVSTLSAMGGIAPGDRFAGMVVSEKVTEISKDPDRTVERLSVREGDDVKEGQELFVYDVDALQLALDKQELQQQQLEASIENYQSQIKELQLERDRVGGRQKLQYTIQIQTAQVDLKEAELNLKAKKAEVKKSKEILKNAVVVSPITGRVTTISETGTDSSGKTVPYITIQQAGSYRVKGMLNELQRGGIMEGDRIRLMSRVDENAVWFGTVTRVDYENPTTGNNNNMYGVENDEMTSTSKYPFYVELDSSEGLILGQHLYLSLDTGDDATPGLQLGSAFICFDDNGKAFVWAENRRGKLEKRMVNLGEYQEMRDSYEILTGLTEADYIAFPDDSVCRSGVPTTRTAASAEGGV